MAIISSVDLGVNLHSVEVDADPTSTSVDAPKGSMILWSGVLYTKLDDGDTTNSVVSNANLRSVLIIKDSSKGGTTYLGHNVFNMTASATNSLVWQLHTPSSWDDSKDPQIHAIGVFDTADTSGDVVFEWGLEATGNTEIMDGVDDLVINYTETVTDVKDAMYYSTMKTVDRATLGLTTNDHLRVELRRIGGDANDTRVGTFKLLHAMVIWPRKSMGVTA